ncbi:MAG: hypothetical protein ABL940_11160 [Bacteroidia bacterium]
MNVKIEIPEYTTVNGFRYNWELGFEIKTKVDNGLITISANKEGLVSLANHLLNLAQENIPSKFHLHLDNSNSLEVGSVDLIIEKT